MSDANRGPLGVLQLREQLRPLRLELFVRDQTLVACLCELADLVGDVWRIARCPVIADESRWKSLRRLTSPQRPQTFVQCQRSSQPGRSATRLPSSSRSQGG
jgi:hypothetical protein